VFAVIKDDAYGCGAVQVAQTVERSGVERFAVARMSEAEELKDGRVHGAILVLGECTMKELEYASSSEIRIAINSIDSLRNMVTSSLDLIVHINIDTGMGRLGLQSDEVEEACRIIDRSSNIRIESIFSHFSCADVPGSELVPLQWDRYRKAISLFRERGVECSFYHMPNSAASVNYNKEGEIYSRLGIVLYGCRPDPAVDPEIDLKNVMSLKAPVSIIKKIRAGDTVSYGANFKAEKATCIATIAAGYAHGIPRLLSGNMEVLIRGKKYPVVGNVTMDYIMADVGLNSGIDAGDEVVIMGSQHSEAITADEIALKCNTIGYEILCSIGRNREKRFVGRA
jgi:alanine racemase